MMSRTKALRYDWAAQEEALYLFEAKAEARRIRLSNGPPTRVNVRGASHRRPDMLSSVKKEARCVDELPLEFKRPPDSPYLD
jgi:hypothetical protein